MKNIETLLPNPIIKLYRLIKKNEGQIWIYGETLCELCFTENPPIHYQLAIKMDRTLFLHQLAIPDIEKIPIRKDLVFYFEKDRFFYLNQDFLPDELENRFYIDVLFIEDDWHTHIKEAPISIDRFGWDFELFYDLDIVKEDFNNKNLALSAEQSTELSKDLMSLVKLTRYMVKFNFDTGQLISPTYSNMNKQNKSHIYRDLRWKKEFIKLLELPKPSEALECLRKQPVLEYVFSELLEGYQVYQNKFHEFDVYYHSLAACDAANIEEPLIRLAALFHDIGKPRSKREVAKGLDQHLQNIFYDHENIGARMSYQILKKFGFLHPTVKKVAKLTRLHMFHYTREWTDSAVRRLIRKADQDLPNMFKLRFADRIGSGKKEKESRALINLEKRINQILAEDSRTTVLDLAIDGNDLMEQFNLPPGRQIGQILKHLLKVILEDPEQNNHDTLMSLAEDFVQEITPGEPGNS